MIKNSVFKEKIFLYIAERIFMWRYNREDKNNRGVFWKRKKEKYYGALFTLSKISIKECVKLLKDEWRREITILPRLVVVISTRCSLKCKYCGEFIPYFPNKEDISVDEIKKELDYIFKQMDYIHTIEFIGGEPFLHKELDKILKYAIGKSSKIGKIELTTNAVVTIADSTMQILKNQKIVVLISVYPVNRERVRRLEHILKKYGIKYEKLNARAWSNFGEISYNNSSEEEIEKMYMWCNASRECRTLYKGKVLYCSRGPYMMEMGKNPNGLSIKASGMPVNLYMYYLGGGSDNICRYCHYNRRPIPVAEQLSETEVHNI